MCIRDRAVPEQADPIAIGAGRRFCIAQRGDGRAPIERHGHVAEFALRLPAAGEVDAQRGDPLFGEPARELLEEIARLVAMAAETVQHHDCLLYTSDAADE